MQNISNAVVDKVKEEAQAIINEAEEEAKRELEKAKAQRDARFETEKKRLLSSAQEEAARITAQNAMQARQKVANAKAGVLDEIVQKTRAEMKKAPARQESLAYLINDAITGIGQSDKLILLVSETDLALAKDIVKADKGMSAVITEIKTCECDGGVLVENEDQTLSVDNTYTTRLDMLLPRILPEISKKLF